MSCEVSKCKYGRTYVASWGRRDSPYLLIAEAPGKVEVQKGRPLIGPAGQTQKNLLASVGIDMDAECALMNTVCCVNLSRRPPKPTPEEVIACSPRFWEEVAAFEGKIIICLGAVAAERLFPGVKITEIRGKLRAFRLGEITYVATATYHPSSLLHGRKEYKELILEDLARAKRFVDTGE